VRESDGRYCLASQRASREALTKIQYAAYFLPIKQRELTPIMSISPEQCKAARALIGWSRRDLAQASDVSDSALFSFEERRRSPHRRTVNDIRRALENAGVTFVDQNGGGPGVRFATPKAP